MALPVEVVIILCIMCGILAMLFVVVFGYQIMHYQFEYSRRRRRRNQILPMSRIFRLLEIRRQMYEIQLEQHYKQQEKVNEQIKNSVIFINPDHTMQIGFTQQRPCAMRSYKLSIIIIFIIIFVRMIFFH